MSRNIETTTNSNRDIFVEPRKVDLEETLGSAAKREVTNVIAPGKASVPTAGAVAEYVTNNANSSINENGKLFEQVITNFNQQMSYTATEDAIALAYFRGSSGTYQMLLVNDVVIRFTGESANDPCSVTIPIKKGDKVSSRYTGEDEACWFKLVVYSLK